jgi:hypothetical protein
MPDASTPDDGGGTGCSAAELTTLEAEMAAALDEGITDPDISTNPNFVLLLESDGGRRFTHAHGDATPTTEYESASTSKWVTAVVILELVDRGVLLARHQSKRALALLDRDRGAAPASSELHLGLCRRSALRELAHRGLRGVRRGDLHQERRHRHASRLGLPIRQRTSPDRRAHGDPRGRRRGLGRALRGLQGADRSLRHGSLRSTLPHQLPVSRAA